MPLIIPTNSISAVGYDVANSLRFSGASSDYLDRTFGASGNKKTFTFSFWVKKCELATAPDTMTDAQMLFGGQQSSYPAFQCLFLHTNDTIFIKDAQASNNIQLSIKTEMQFRDPSAWYHIVFAVDTTQATESDRAKLYVNGVLQTALDGENAGGGASDNPLYPPQNTDLQFNSNEAHYINKYATNYEDMYMAEFVFVDGQQLDATSFGEFDADTGIWKPIDVSGLTFGTNGLYLDFENSGSLGADVSGNGNNFTVNNLTSIDQTTDTCTNNFATWNPLTTLRGNNSSLSNGNTTLTDTGTTDTDGRNYSTIGASNGKWYFEIKASAFSNNNHTLGVSFSNGDVDANSNDSVRLRYTTSNNTNYIRSFGTIVQSNLTSFSAGSIIGVAVDLDNGTVQFYVNGSTYGSQVTGLSSNIANKTMFVQSYGEGGAGRTFTLDANFGNPPFTISSGNSDGNGYGNFEYAVPSGYYALNTKNLAEYG